jgi:hypothetical protein
MKAGGKSGPLSWIDFDKELPDEIKKQLMSPATNDLTEMYDVPLHPILMK